MSIVHDGPVQQQVIRVPHHVHPLTSNNPLLIYQAYKGNWQCDNCRNKHGHTQFPFHCNVCSYDLCQPCAQGGMLPEVHVHKLFNVNVTLLQNQNWSCSVCKSNGNGTGQTHVLLCSQCGFYMCRTCSTEIQHPIHSHPLKIVNTDIIYPHTSGNWGCDVCGRTSRFNERYSRHCTTVCEFDVCNSCVKEYHVPSLHHHPLVRADPNVVYAHFAGNWGCDNCGLVSSNPLTNNKPWHCSQCEYDLCNNCMQMLNSDLNLQLDVAGPPSTLRGPLSSTAITNPHLDRLNHQLNEPKEPVSKTTTEKGRVVTSTEAVDDGDECIICLENPKNATLIHGDTGHLCCCWSCAQVLKRRGDTCPICRQRIDHVIKQFKA